MPDQLPSGPIAWMAKHRVAANLLMLIIVLGGMMSAFNLKQEVFPEFSMDMITVSVPYPGASPAEVEQGIILAIEEKVRGLDGIKQVNSTAKEGVGSVVLEIQTGEDPNKILSDVKNEVDRIITFPEETEEPTVSLAIIKRGVISLLISGSDDLKVLHNLAEQARAELLALPDISQVDLKGVPPLELEIAISKEQLESWGLSLDEVAMQVRAASVEMAGGSMDTERGNILVKLSDRKLTADDFAGIPIRVGSSGSEVTLGEIARIRDGYAESDQAYFFEGKRVVELSVSRVGKETPSEVAEAVKGYLVQLRQRLPANIVIETWNDDSVMLKERIDLLVKNALAGLLLVIIVLGLFLQRKLAFWVAIGIPISFLGAFLLMGWLSISINMITLFALIITLGMVVDDAIVVSENVFTKMQEGIPPLKAAIDGTLEMMTPVSFSILTSVAAFSPLLFIPGTMGKIFFFIPAIVISVLAISLVECYLILPAHLGHSGNKKSKSKGLLGLIDSTQEKTNGLLVRFVKGPYQNFLRKALRNRHITMSVASAMFILVIATLPAGILKFSFFPKMEGDVINAAVRLPYGVTLETAEEVSSHLREAERKAAAEMGADKVTGRFLKLGEAGGGHGPVSTSESGTHLISMAVSLVTSKDRTFSAEQYAAAWKKHLPPIPGVEALSIGSQAGPNAGKAIDIQLSHFDTRVLARASKELSDIYATYPALTDIENSYSAGKPQLDFKLKEGAKALGISSNDIARVLRSSFYGAEALREQRGRNEIKVMARLPENERDSEGDLENLQVKTKSGAWVRLGDVTDFSYQKAPTEIKREDGRRVVNVSAEIAEGKSTSAEMMRTLEEGPLKALTAKYPGLQTGLSGMQKEQKESFANIGPNFILALFVMFALLAIPFRSYAQPIIVMSAIPFGFVGAFLGHLLLGYSLSFISVMGIIALSGVVVNDSLVLIDAVNKFRAEGNSALEAVILAGMRRFRPILLTSLTTFFGLLPMIFETSLQARFLIPMAISLGFGALFVTGIVLVVIPTLYIILEDVLRLLGFRERA